MEGQGSMCEAVLMPVLMWVVAGVGLYVVRAKSMIMHSAGYAPWLG